MRFKGIPRHARVILGAPRTTRGLALPTRAALAGVPRKPQLDGLPVLRGLNVVVPTNWYPRPIQNSLRLRAAANATMESQFGAGGNDILWTLNFNVKRGLIDAANRQIIAWGTSGDYGGIRFNSNYQLEVFRFNGSFQFQVITNAVYRDPSDHMNINVRYDSAQGTAANRIIIEVNGTQITSFATASYPSSGLTSRNLVNTAYFSICGTANTGGTYFDGLVSEVRLIDGQALPASAFIQLDSVYAQYWQPKLYAGGYGTQGRFYEFKDASAATAAAIGKDTSGNGLNITPSNISVAAGVNFDQSGDTPTNNVCALNLVYPGMSGGLWRNGGLEYSANGTGTHRTAVGTFAIPSTGKWYWEVTACKNANGESIGVIDLLAASIAAGTEIGARAAVNDYIYRSDGTKKSANSATAYGATFTAGDVIGCAWDASAGTIEFFKNGASQGVAYSGIATSTGLWAPAGSSAETAYEIFNFGQRAFANAAPIGFKTLCTDNLPVPAILTPNKGLAISLDSGANIDATVAAARAAFPAYVDIKKDRAAATTWAWQFGHDPSNEHACGSTDTYQAKRVFSGANSIVGYSIRIDPAYGTAAGSQAHVNGVADTITHNLGLARYMIYLFPRNGGDVYVYHSDLTAGNLLRLNNVAAQSASTVITSIGANSFQIGAGVATGTLDYLVIGEKDGFTKVYSYIGNASADGPVSLLGMLPAATFSKNADSAAGIWLDFDDQRDPFNAMNHNLYMDQAVAEDTASVRFDYLAGGLKPRNSNASENGSGNKIVGVAFARRAFRWSNAR